MSSAALQPEPAPLSACTISRDVQNFDLLIEDMEAALGEAWGDLGFQDAYAFLDQLDADSLEFVALAVDDHDENDLTLVGEIISKAKEKGIKVVLIAEEVSPIALHQLLRLGADDFIPYPLPEGELNAAIERMRAAPAPELVPEPAQAAPTHKGAAKNGSIFAVHGFAGGAGATTFATNLAWELATIAKKKEEPPKVCLIDLDLQFGSASTFLDLQRRDTIFELLTDTESADVEVFHQALQAFEDKLHVFTAPSELLPLDLVGPEDIQKILDFARESFDYVIVDMPSTFVSWTETVLSASDIYFAMIEMDMRSAQNALRVIKGLKSEDLPIQKLRYVMNRSPKFTDLQGKSRVKRMAESLDISIEVMMPDGGKPVTQGSDHGQPLQVSAAKNPLRKEIHKLAQSLHDLNVDAAAAGK
ncbi:AAA family ATPase [Algirhabdus cladophorae]|uniref:AAA family ATPase n=1 Tax=Algirhabdus cladophorae TaxID=3377108 RepID=UPI003B845657